MKKAKIIALLAAFAVACAAWLILNRQIRTEREETVYVSMVVAQSDLEPGAVIDKSMVTSKKIPPKYVPQGGIPEVHIDEVLGKVVKYPIVSGEPVVSERIGEPGEAATGLSALVDDGMRAFSLAVETESGVAGMILPGNRVDILYTYEEPLPALAEESFKRYRCKAEYILQDIEVLAVDQTTDKMYMAVMDQLVLYESVTLSLKPEAAAVLAAFQQSERDGMGKIRLVLRQQGDREIFSQQDIVGRGLEVIKE